MKKNIEHIERKNVDQSTELFFEDKNSFSILKCNNTTTEKVSYFHELNHSYIQLFFGFGGNSNITFNFKHCIVNLEQDESCIVYFRETESKLRFHLDPNSELIIIFIPLNEFHSLFSDGLTNMFDFEKLSMGKPIIEKKQIKSNISVILHELFQQKINSNLKGLYTKGKIYELLSLYFNVSNEQYSEQCPFMANEDTVSKIKQVKDIITEQMASPPSLEELSKTVGLNIKKLKMGFKELYGMPVFTFLFHYKMEYAKRLLTEENNNVNEVANIVGYSTSSHFIVAFKKKFGITPKQFTKNETN